MSTRRSAQKNNGSGFNKKSATFLKSTTAIVAALMLLPTNVGAQDATPTNSWDYDVVVGGNVGKDTSTVGITDITVTGGNGFVEGNADIYDGHTVNVTGDAGTTFAYRDNRDNIDSTLNGNLNSNIQVVIIDKDGLFFGDNFNADVQSLVATTGDISVDNLMDSNADLLISNVGQGGSIVQNGTVTVSEAGLAAFVSPFVTNNGVINATLGTVSFAAGETVTLDLYGDGLVEVAVEGELANALLENRGAILAQGGRVQITAIAAKDTLSNLVNNTGIIDVSSVEVDGGKIVLSGGDAGTVRNAGLLRTSEGGSVDIDAERFVHEGDNFFIIPQRKPDAPEQELQFVDTVEVIEVRPATLAAIETAGGDVNIETSGDVIIGSNGSYGGYETAAVRNDGEQTTFDGGAVIDADGGDIKINNEGVFFSAFENTLRTSGEGSISVRQNQAEDDIIDVARTSSFTAYPTPIDDGIQNAIDAISNTGTGTNTVTVGAGSFGAVEINHANLTLRGANAGIHGSDARGAETIINPNSPGIHITADNAVVNGVAVVGGTAEGILVDNADNVVVTNSVISGSATHGVSVVRSNNVRVRNNDISDTGEVGVKARLSNDAVIANNTIYDVATGIQSDYGHRARIVDNDISDVTKEDNAKSDAIRVNGGQNVRINRNTISNINDDGIFVADASGSLTIRGNEIVGVGVTSDTGSGIDIFASRADAVITDNIVAFAADDGIAIRSSNADSSSVIRRNISGFVNGSAITVDRNATIVQRNIAGLAGEHAIFINKSQGVQIRGNLVGFTDGDGIRLTNSKNALVHNNFATNVGGAGVFVKFSNDSVVSNNEISESGTGIHSEYSDRIKIDGNDISDITLNATDASDGIYIRGGSSVEVANNIITDVNDDGIFINDASGTAKVRDNTITNVGLDIVDSGNGIEFIFARGDAIVSGNTVSNVRDDGILFKESRNDTGSYDVLNNVVTNTGENGIKADKNARLIFGNKVSVAGEDGITVARSEGVIFDENIVTDVEEHGIYVTRSNNAVLGENTVTDAELNGIYVRLSNDARIVGNTVSDAGTGIRSAYGHRVDISGNIISDITKNANSDADGIFVEGGSSAFVAGNTITDVNDEGIFLTNFTGHAVVNGNTVTNAGLNIPELGNGIELIFANGTADVIGNVVSNVRDNGIFVKQPQAGGTAFNVAGNTISNVGVDGIRIERNAALVANNTITAAGDDGIDVTNSVDAQIINNDVSDVQDTGITVRLSNGVDVDDNDVSDAGTGISVEYSNNALIRGNDISDIRKNNTSAADGIYVEGGSNVGIFRNFVSNVNDDGIFVTNSSGNLRIIGNGVANVGQDISELGNGIEVIFANGTANIDRNSVNGARDFGVLVKQSSVTGTSFDVTNNRVKNVGADGINIDRNANDVSDNTVRAAGDDGIDVTRSVGANISDNTVSDVQDTGITVRLSNDVDVDGNTVSDAGTGVKVAYSNNADITNNEIFDITKNNTSNADAVHVEGGSNITVSGNAITNINDDGIFLTNTSGTTNVFDNIINSVGQDITESGNAIELIFTQGGANVHTNSITSARDTGILIKQSTSGSGPFVVDNNVISSVGASGIDIDKNAASVSDNAVDTAGENGIIVRSSPGVQIVNNAIAITQEAGIRVRLSNDAVVTGNGVFYVGTGIRSDYSNRIQISDNLIRDVVNRNDLFADGIHVSGGSSVVVSGNDINYTNDDSIFVANSTGTLVVDGNDVSNAGLDIDSFGNGIELLFTRGNAVVTNNTVDTVRDSGILIKQTQPSAGSFVVTDNDVANSGVHGFYANGANIDSIVFLGNTLTDNTFAQARFESGAIDMSDITNPNVFLNTTGGPAVGLQFDKTTSSDLTIVGETLGATEFTGYTDVDSFYVRFEDGAILSAPSTPIVIDANAVSFDGVIADAFPGSILPAAQLQFIEDRLFDADDAAVNGRGQIFEPVAPTPAGITNLEDFLQTPEDSQSTSNNASLRINGLPPVSLANVGDLNAVEPAAGDETGELNDIEPAAGDQQLAQVTCASDAANAVGTASVSYVFGGSFEDSLAGAAACSINAI